MNATPEIKKYVGKNALIVEDNPLNAKLFSDLLTEIGFDVSETGNGIEAIEMIKKNLPDFVLMDIQLHGVSGLEAIKVVKQNEATKNIPIIAVTAFAMESDKQEILESGCEAYMPKPISIAPFFDTIDHVMQG